MVGSVAARAIGRQHLARHHLGIHEREPRTIHPDLRRRLRRLDARQQQVAARTPGGFAGGKLAKAADREPGGGFAARDDGRAFRKVGCGKTLEIGFELRERGADVLLHQDAHHLHGHPEQRLQRIASQQLRAQIDRDHPLRAHRPHHIDRQVANQPAIEQQATVDLLRRDHAGNRHAGAHRLPQLAVVEHHHLAGLDVGRDRAIGNGQVVEFSAGRFGGQLAQEPAQAFVGDRPPRGKRTLPPL